MKTRLGAAGIALLFALWPPGPVRADVPAMEDAERIAREAKLRQRATEWLRLRAQLRAPCPRCGGQGKTQLRGGRNPGSTVTCSHCRGGKVVVDGRVFMQVYFAYYSPAFRAQNLVKEELDARWRRYIPYGPSSVSGSEFIERFEIEDLHLVDATHGIVRVWLDEHRRNPSRPTELRWIWSSEKPGRTGHWYVYEGEVDGPWPRSAALAPYAGTRDMGETMLAKLSAGWPDGARHAPTHLHKAEKRLVVTLLGKDGLEHRELYSQLHAEALDVFARAFGLGKRWERVTIVAGMLWRNGLGETRTRPYAVLQLDRPTWERIRPENLAPGELLDALGHVAMSYEDWVHWK